MSEQQKKPFVIIVTGPTASGKTEFSYELAKHLPIEIINADSGQFYTPLSIGTAKPDWKAQATPAHLFDISDKPSDITVHEYYKLVQEKIDQITIRKNTPCIVGGSLFYLKSLLFPTENLPAPSKRALELVAAIKPQARWAILHTIDPVRAQAIHPNDHYRLERALLIWFTTQRLPSTYRPQYNPSFNALVIAITPPKELLRKRIDKRTLEMIHDGGWVNEAKSLLKTPWQPFIERKGLIGYKELFEWLSSTNKSSLEKVITLIQQETRRYAKRQITFINGLFTAQDKANTQTSQRLICLRISSTSPESIKSVVKAVLEEKRKFLVGKKKVLR